MNEGERLRGLVVGLSFAAGLATGAGCIPIGAFACSQDGECGPEGFCEEDGYCASVDETCPSQRRYSRYAPGDIAERCVEPEGAGVESSTSGEPAEGSSASSTGDTSETSGGDPVRPTGDGDGDGSTGDTGLASACLPSGRDPTEPLLLYDFCEGEGTSVESITELKLELVFEEGTIGDGFTWVPDGLLLDGDTTDAHTALRSYEPVFGRLDPCRESGEVTLEVWATPADESQGGPTGIVTLGPASGSAGVDLGLFMNPDWSDPGYVATLRTTEDDLRMDWLGTPYLKANHLVLVHETGATTLYLDGDVLITEPHPGDLSGWNPNFDFVLGNLSSYDVRNWQGTFHLVALYCEALDAAQVLTNFEAGHRPPAAREARHGSIGATAAHVVPTRSSSKSVE